MSNRLLTITALTLCFAAPAFGQRNGDGAIPSVIKNAFAASYPQSTDVEWEQEAGLYKVEFETADDVDREIWYNASSDIVREEIEISQADLPAAVLRTIAAKFDGYAIDDVERVITPDGERFQVELEALLREDREITLAADGSLLAERAD